MDIYESDIQRLGFRNVIKNIALWTTPINVSVGIDFHIKTPCATPQLFSLKPLHCIFTGEKEGWGLMFRTKL